jgi:UDP-glucuronate decarboxylase
MNYFLEEDLSLIVQNTSQSLEKLAGKTVLVTGAAGFLGRYFIAVFQLYNKSVQNPINMIALDNHITSTALGRDDQRRKDPNIEWIYGDAELGAKLPDKIDFLIHAAGIASPEHYQANPLETINVSVNATQSLLEKAKSNNARFLYFSSSEIYGDPHPTQIPTKEDYRGNVSCRGPRACYDESKRLGETICWIFETYFSVHVSVVRPFNIYGPGMMPKDYRVMPNFANSWLTNVPLKVYGGGNQTRTFCYITDAIDAFLKILVESKKSGVYNVGNPYPEISMIDLAELVKNSIDSIIQIEQIDYPNTYPKDDPTRRCPDITKLASELNFRPTVSLEEGIDKFFKWAKLNYPLIGNSN